MGVAGMDVTKGVEVRDPIVLGMQSMKASQLLRDYGKPELRGASFVVGEAPRTQKVSSIVWAAQEVADRFDALGPVDLTVALKACQPHTHSEGALDRFAEFYVITSVMDGSGKQPDFKTRLFEKMKVKEPLPLGAGGMLIGMVRKPRWFVDIHTVLMESDSDIRYVGEAIERARKESGLKELVAEAGALAAFDPTMVTRVTSAVDIFMAMVQALLCANGDDSVATFHDFYLKSQMFGAGMRRAIDVPGGARFEYQVDLSPVE